MHGAEAPRPQLPLVIVTYLPSQIHKVDNADESAKSGCIADPDLSRNTHTNSQAFAGNVQRFAAKLLIPLKSLVVRNLPINSFTGKWGNSESPANHFHDRAKWLVSN